MNIIKHRINQIKFYIGKYGFIKTVKKCIKTVLRKIIRFLKGEKDLQYGASDGMELARAHLECLAVEERRYHIDAGRVTDKYYIVGQLFR